MSAHDESLAADRAVEALLDAATPGTPLGEEVERLLNERGGPVPVDEAEVRRSALRLQERIRGARAPSRRRRPVVWATLAALAAIFLAFVLTRPTSVPQAAQREPLPVRPEVVGVATPPEAPGADGFEMRAGSQLAVRGERILLEDGVVGVTRDEPRPGAPHQVRLDRLGVTVDPVGTVFYVGLRDEVGAVYVQEGRVRLMHDAQGHLGVVEAGGWALLSRHPDGEGLAVHRPSDGAIDASALGLEPAVLDLMADIRWMTLPPESRASILEP